MRRSLLMLSCLAFFACPRMSGVDGGTLDSGADAAANDAGSTEDAGPRPRFDAGTPDAGFTSIAAVAWCDSLAVATCSRKLRCSTLSEDRFSLCVEAERFGCDGPRKARSTNEGRLSFDVDAGLSCLNGYGVGACELIPAACANVFTGQVKPDGGCLAADECNSEGSCFQYDSLCPHRCRAYVAMGQACDSFLNLCNPQVATCLTNDAGALECQPLRQPGERCVYSSDCGANAVCTSNTCVPTYATADSGCSVLNGYPLCDVESFCHVPPVPDGTPALPGTCVRRGGLGAVCNSGTCLQSLRCTGVVSAGLCARRSKLGEPCALVFGSSEDFQDCEDGLFCSGRAGACVRLPPGDGGDCSYQASGYQCDFPATCRYMADGKSSCVDRLPIGSPCSFGTDCLSNVCETSQLVDGGFGLRCAQPCSVRADGGF